MSAMLDCRGGDRDAGDSDLDSSCCLVLSFIFCRYVVDRSMKGQEKSMDNYTRDKQFSMQLMYDGCYK
jgi:hypothetical protein